MSDTKPQQANGDADPDPHGGKPDDESGVGQGGHSDDRHHGSGDVAGKRINERDGADGGD